MLEKMRPMEQRFRYQLDKLLRVASSGRYKSFLHCGLYCNSNLGSEHPLDFKPAPENMVSKVEGEGSGEEDNKDAVQTVGAYVPPRVVAMPYLEGMKRQRSRPRSQPGKGQLITELGDEITDYPTEVHVSGCCDQ